MKRILIALILIIGFLPDTYGRAYYFSNTNGDDSRTSLQAQNSNTPWKTIGKLNLFFPSLVAGDSVLFRRGESYYGSITVGASGTLGNRIVLSYYGAGTAPLINGWSSITSWVQSGNIYTSSSAVSTLSSCNIASINNYNYAQGRTPNTGYWAIQSNGGSSITDNVGGHLNTINWTGAEVVLRKYRWVTDKFKIASQSGNTISFANSGDAIQNGFGYFLQNDTRTLDLQNEWSYSSSTKKFSIYSTTTPSNIQIPTLETGIDINGKNYITIDGLAIKGFNTTGVSYSGLDYITVKNCEISFIGVNGLYGYQNGGDASYSLIQGNTITDIGSRGVWGGYSSNSLCTQNTLNRIGHYPGMGTNGDDSYTGLIFIGNNTTVSYNSIKNVGYCGIRWDGNSALIKGNFVDSTNYVKDDGGGIYVYPVLTGPSSTVTYTQRIVRDNIVMNTLGAIAGGEPSANHSEGYALYTDGTSPNISYINNTIINAEYGLFFNAGHDNIIDSNKTYNCKRGLYHKNYSGFGIEDVTVTNNQFIARNPNDGSSCGGGTGQYPVYYEPGASNMPASFFAANNIYARPMDQVNGYVWRDFSGEGGDVCSSIAAWKTKTGKDAGSVASPYTISNINDMIIVYNETSSNKVISLGANYRSLKAVSYSGTITLLPYTSEVLILNSSGNTAPSCTAIASSTITLPVNSTSLNGVASSTMGGSITTWAWLKTSGPVTGTISSPSAQNATAVNLVEGTYQFTVTATDNNGLSCAATKTVIVNPAIIPPSANAGVDQSITLPTNSTTLSGSGSGGSGTITTYAWGKILGGTGMIVSPSSATTSVTGLVEGTYQFRLTVTADNTLTAIDTIEVIVLPTSNVAPTANAGTNQTITLPTNTATLVGSGTDSDGTIASYSWVKISGPSGGTLSNSAIANPTVNSLIEGTYEFELTVTDNGGLIAVDRVNIIVMPYVNPNPPVPTKIIGVQAYINIQGKAVISWEVVNVLNTDRFVIQKKSRSWGAVSTIYPKIGTNTYKKAVNANYGDNYYRIKIYDKVGPVIYSAEVKLTRVRGTSQSGDILIIQ
jgi:hypothetical protein